MKILLICDDRPGHYHLSEGVVAALERKYSVDVTRLEVRRRRWLPSAMLARAFSSGSLSAPGLLRAAYGVTPERLSAAMGADIVISAGGDTILANAAASRMLGARNIFCGTLRKLPPDHFSLVVSSYREHADLARHIVTLKPNGMDPDTLERAGGAGRLGPERLPERVGLLVGGDSGLFRYQRAEWERLVGLVPILSEAWGCRWSISTSRRTPDFVGDLIAELAETSAAVEEFIDFRKAGPGTLARLLSNVDAVIATEDSSTMISEAVCARLPVIGVSPRNHDFKPEEAGYRQFMREQDWCRFVALEMADAGTLAACLAQISPMAENHLDRLAELLIDHLDLERDA